MNDEGKTIETDRHQVDLWSHIQTTRPDLFQVSKNRLESLVRIAGKPTGILLNIGCGSGHLEITAMREGWSVISVDPDQESIKRIKEFGIDARCGLIESLPVASSTVDVVICTEVFEHLTPETMEVGLSEIKRVLRTRGRLIGTVPYCENLADSEVFCPHCCAVFHRWGHHQSFDEDSMSSRLRKYLEIDMVKPAIFPSWQVLNWKGKLSASARVVFSWFGIFGASANLLFVAKNS